MKKIQLDKLQDFKRSMTTIEKSISYDRFNYRDYALKGDIFQKTNQFDSALIYYEKAKIGLANDQFLLNNIGTLYLKRGNFFLAKDIFDSLSLVAPNNVDYLYNISFVYYKLTSYDTALNFVNKAIEIKNSDDGLYNLKGQILGKKGNLEEAAKSFEKSIQLNPKENIAIENLRRLKLYYKKQ